MEVGAPLLIVENFFPLGSKTCHELAFVYAFSPSNPSLLDPSWTSTITDAGVTIHLRWFPVDRLESVNLKPSFLRTLLQAPPADPQHTIVRE